MKKYIFLFVALWAIQTTFAQQSKKVKIVRSELLKGFTHERFIRIIKPVFEQDGSTLAADSANFSQEKNTFDAFGNVVITQPSGTVIYADLLNFDGNSKVALLTNNVRLVDRDATLYTNNLTYNTGTRIGTYHDGGKIVDTQNILTSITGHYYTNTRDAYFRHNVILTAPDGQIKSDTLRYNMGSKMAYFYGPTRIYGKDDTLYTENGDYNTLTQQGRFGKNNLYSQGSKSLKGDSLFFDKKTGYGRAVKNITFSDINEKITLKGDLGIYHKKDESILVTQNAYVILETKPDSINAKADSIWMAADTLYSKIIRGEDIKPIRRESLKQDDQLEDVTATNDQTSEDDLLPVKSRKKSKEAIEDEEEEPPIKPVSTPTHNQEFNSPTSVSPTNKPHNQDELSSTQIQTALRDTISTYSPPKIDASMEEKKTNRLSQSTSLTSTLVPNQKQPAAIQKTTTVPAKATQTGFTGTNNSISKTIQPVAATDTAKFRIVKAFHNAKVFKLDLQAKADSIFFSYKDSTIRCFTHPMIWTQGSQFSADTIYLQMKNRRLDNMLLQRNGFIVSTEAADSTKFNQVKGKLITGYFKNNKLNNLFVDGNAESIYFIKEDDAYTGMNKMLSSRMKVLFESNALKDIIVIRKPEGSYFPIEAVPANDQILNGFIWKPKDRPKSKEEIIPSYTDGIPAIPEKKRTKGQPKSNSKPKAKR